MSIFGSIMSRIFGHGQAAERPAPAQHAGQPATPGATVAQPKPGATPGGADDAMPATAAGSPRQPVDVGAILTELAAKNPQKLDWRHSIVDLMKLLGLDSSLEARKELARELHYTGSTADSAAMNIWLHRQVMQKLAENGGTVPEELRR